MFSKYQNFKRNSIRYDFECNLDFRYSILINGTESTILSYYNNDIFSIVNLRLPKRINKWHIFFSEIYKIDLYIYH